ncbi:MAG: hypothetical protein KAY24_10500, partial [Candidatus Eisenbacteria sp.]|nr:hypothetical protein [Candidatus Eisenbacteria bacterium]
LRGTGPRGLGAMEPRTELPSQRGDSFARILIRPLLDFRRRELREFAQLAQLDWMEDASNRDLSLLRNRIRTELMPLLTRDYNPRLVEALAALARLQRAESEPVAHMAQELEKQVLLSEEGGQAPEKAVHRLTLDAIELTRHPEALITQVLWRTYQRIAGPEVALGTRHMQALLGLVAKCRDRSTSEVHLPGRVRARLADGQILIEFHSPRQAREFGKKALDGSSEAS